MHLVDITFTEREQNVSAESCMPTVKDQLRLGTSSAQKHSSCITHNTQSFPHVLTDSNIMHLPPDKKQTQVAILLVIYYRSNRHPIRTPHNNTDTICESRMNFISDSLYIYEYTYCTFVYITNDNTIKTDILTQLTGEPYIGMWLA